MRTLLLATMLISTLVWSTGCMVVVKEEKKYPPAPDVVCIPTDAVVEEIDAVGKLSFESGRLEGYQRIAARRRLNDTVQAYLVEVILDKLSFESSKEAALMTLIGNPCFSLDGRQAILNHLERLSFESTKTRILKAIDERTGNVS
jgi:hypothetical protein